MSKKRLISPPVGTTLRQARGEKSLVEGGRESMDEEREGCISPEGRCTARNDSLLLWATDRRIEPPSPINSARGGRKGWIFFFFFFSKESRQSKRALDRVLAVFSFFSLSLLFSQTLLLRLYALRVHDALLLLLVIPVGPSLRNFISALPCA